LHDAQAGFGAHGREHIGVASDLSRGDVWHISILLEIQNGSQVVFRQLRELEGTL
jgi:hypothetical protein